MTADPITTIEVDDTHRVLRLLQRPEQALACCVLAHGAGAGMTHRFMVAVADGLAAREVATLRYQFPYMEAGSKRPDRPALAHATVRAAVAAASRLAPGLPLFAGGKSFGARMTSQTQAAAPLLGVRGLIFLGTNRPTSGRGIWPACISRCCSYKGHAMPWRTRGCWCQWSMRWVGARR